MYSASEHYKNDLGEVINLPSVSNPNDLGEVINLPSVSNPISQLKGNLIGDGRQCLHVMQSNIDSVSNRDLPIEDIQNLTETLQNKSAELLDQSTLNSEGSLELDSFAQSGQKQSEIHIGTVNNAESALTLDANHYYENLNNAPIMVYQMPSGSIVPFESLVSVPISKSAELKNNESVDILNNSYTNHEVFISNHASNTQPLYILPETIKFKGQMSDKMLISQIYSSDDPNLFLDTRQPLVRNNKCDINIAETLNPTDLNLTSNDFSSNISVASESDIQQLTVSTSYTSTDTDSEVALTLASLGNLKNDKIKQDYSQNLSLESCFNTEHKTHILTENMDFGASDDVIKLQEQKKTWATSNVQNRKERSIQNKLKRVDTSTEMEYMDYENSKSEHSLGTGNSSDRNQFKPPTVRKERHEPRKKNLLGQLLKASKHCEPASLIPEGVVGDVIPAVGYRIMDMSNLSEMIRMMHRCSKSSSKGLIVMQEQASLREGAVSQLSIICTGCQEGAVCATSSKSPENIFDINARVETLKREFDIEESKVQRMLEILGIFYRPANLKPIEQPEHVAVEDEQNKKKRKKTFKNKNKKIECKICHKKVSGTNYLKTHMLVHDNLLHTCPYCQAYFKRVFNLQEHIKKHKKIKYECDQCHKKYTDRSTLCAHIKSFHLEEYKLECEICSKKFYHKPHYEEHLRVHTREKPFACDICGKRYPYKNSVKKHMQTHSNGTKYKCRLCGKWFRWLFGIRQHLVQQHKVKKCDIEAQVITDVIAEVCPVVQQSSKQIADSVRGSDTSVNKNINKSMLEPPNTHTISRERSKETDLNVSPCENNLGSLISASHSQSKVETATTYSNLTWKRPL